MRQPLSLALFSLLLAGCAGPLPQPDSNMAWVALRAQTIDVFLSDRLAGKRTHAGRSFKVPPGSHELEAHYEFEVSRARANLLTQTMTMTCTMV
ncbi:MAG TPA: hypothetical protein DCQ75_06465, partial [Pseudomonas sp.]|nr:hypothetical protein [Pseudomonas sp.]